MVDGDVIPVIDVLFFLFHQLEFLTGIVDEGAEILLLRLPDLVAKYLIDLALDVAGGILEYMLESFEFSMNVCQEMLRAFGEVENGL